MLPLMPDDTQRSVQGRVSVHPRGFGFLNVERGLSAFIAPPDLNPFLADDLVSATIRRAADGRWSASGLTLLERPRSLLFGEVVSRRGAWSLHADPEIANTDWPLDAGGASLAAGASAVARIEGARLRLERVLPADADLSLERVIARHGILAEFGDTVTAEARELGARPVALAGRQDLRAVPTITVDAPSTRDIASDRST